MSLHFEAMVKLAGISQEATTSLYKFAGAVAAGETITPCTDPLVLGFTKAASLAFLDGRVPLDKYSQFVRDVSVFEDGDQLEKIAFSFGNGIKAVRRGLVNTKRLFNRSGSVGKVLENSRTFRKVIPRTSGANVVATSLDNSINAMAKSAEEAYKAKMITKSMYKDIMKKVKTTQKANMTSLRDFEKYMKFDNATGRRLNDAVTNTEVQRRLLPDMQKNVLELHKEYAKNLHAVNPMNTKAIKELYQNTLKPSEMEAIKGRFKDAYTLAAEEGNAARTTMEKGVAETMGPPIPSTSTLPKGVAPAPAPAGTSTPSRFGEAASTMKDFVKAHPVYSGLGVGAGGAAAYKAFGPGDQPSFAQQALPALGGGITGFAVGNKLGVNPYLSSLLGAGAAHTVSQSMS